MKKILSVLMILSLLGGCALGFSGDGYPAWDGASAPRESICGMFGSDALQLEFDPDTTYSNVTDGMLTACFFAFDAAQQNYLEMFLTLPADLASGSAYTSQVADDISSISLYEVSKGSETLYFAGQLVGVPYPGGTDYEITIDSAAQEGSSLSVSGSLSATLCKIENSYITDTFMELKDVSFQFTISLQDAPNSLVTVPPMPSAPAQPESTQAPQQKPLPATKAPVYTMDPHPAFTLPPDYRVI